MFKVLNEYYIQNEETGEYLDLDKACSLLNEQEISINRLEKEFKELWNDLIWDGGLDE